jgi:cytochrome c peroxidase
MSKSIKLMVLAAVATGMGTVAYSDRVTKLPPLPEFENAAKEPAMADLGKLLYFDSRLSGDGSLSCADCHNPELGFGDSAEFSRGYPSTKHWRNSQTIVNSAYLQNGLHWDGSVPSLIDQVPGAMGTPFGHNINVTLAEERLRQVPEYVGRFQQIWNEPPNIENIAMAIAAFERTLISADSPLDRFIGGDVDALTPSAIRGLQLFSGKANCVACQGGGLATDEDFHNTSVPRNPELFADPEREITFRTAMRGFGVPEDIYMSFERDPGRYAVTGDESDLGAFRTPPLRYLAYTAPYMHNGIFYTLEEVVEFYNNGGTEDVFGTKSPLIKPLGLSDSEKADLVAFLNAMSGTEIIVDIPDLPDYGSVSMQVAAASPSATGAFSNNQSSQNLQSGIQSNSDGLTILSETGTSAGSSVGSLSNSQAADSLQSGIQSNSAGLAVLSGTGLSPQSGDDKFVIVGEGETLGDIARREYGDVLQYKAIYEANKSVIQDPNQLKVGTRLRLP